MSKVLKTIALIAVAVAVVVFAAPIAGALSSVGAGIFGASFTIATSAVVAVGLSVGLAAVGSLFRKTASLSQASSDRLSESILPTAPRKIVFGKTAAGNDVRFLETYGAKKDRYVQVIALASHPLDTIHGWYVENDLVWSPGGGIAANNKPGVVGWRGYGYMGETPVGHPCGTQTLWTTTSKFTGCAYIIVDFLLGNNSISSKMTAVVNGCPLYDPRLDSTRGGSGPQRVEEQSTWRFTSPATGVAIGRNPALALLAWIIGWRIQNPVDGKWNLAWGMGIDPSCINFDNFKLYANICEEQVLTQAGTTVQRYTCDGIFSTADTHETVINAITAAMGSCKLSDVGGQYRLIGGYDDTLGPVQSLADDDIVGGAGSPSPWHWQPAGPLSETYNIARGRFCDPKSLYQLADWGEVDTDTLADGIERTLNLDLGCVDRAETCQRIAKQWLLREALTPGFFSATFGPRAFAVEVGSLVNLTVASLGWNAKLFRVETHKEVHDMIYEMSLREEDPGIYAWDKEEKPLPATIIPAGFDPTMTIIPQGMSLETVTYQST